MELTPMTDSMITLAMAMAILRGVLLGIGIVAALAAALAWAVRTRRLAPFGAGARFSRRWIDPMLRPVERVIVRAGGHPASAPWWGLVAVAVAGALLLSLVQGGIGVAFEIRQAMGRPLGFVRLLASWAFGLLRLALIVRVVASWLPGWRSSRWIRWSFPLTEWMLRPLRRFVPTLGMVDITPLVAYFLLWIVQGLLHIP
jgi:YggT family protein